MLDVYVFAYAVFLLCSYTVTQAQGKKGTCTAQSGMIWMLCYVVVSYTLDIMTNIWLGHLIKVCQKEKNEESMCGEFGKEAEVLAPETDDVTY